MGTINAMRRTLQLGEDGDITVVVRGLSLREVLDDQRRGETSFLSLCLGMLVSREDPQASIAASLMWTSPEQTMRVMAQATGLEEDALLALEFPDFCQVVDAWVEVNQDFFNDLVTKLQRRIPATPLQ